MVTVCHSLQTHLVTDWGADWTNHSRSAGQPASSCGWRIVPYGLARGANQRWTNEPHFVFIFGLGNRDLILIFPIPCHFRLPKFSCLHRVRIEGSFSILVRFYVPLQFCFELQTFSRSFGGRCCSLRATVQSTAGYVLVIQIQLFHVHVCFSLFPPSASICCVYLNTTTTYSLD